MAREDWTSTATILVMVYLVIQCFVVAHVEHQNFQITTHRLLYHANWTSHDAPLPQVDQLQTAYTLQGIKQLDFSLSMSTLSLQRVKTLFPVQLPPYHTIKINLANNPIATAGVDYVLSLIPNGVVNLDLAFDSIDADESLGSVLAKRLNNLSSLRSLKLSLIMSLKSNETLDDYLRFVRLPPQLTTYSLVLIGNQLSHASLAYLENHLSRVKLNSLDLNFYANKLGAEGAETVARSLVSQNQLEQLSLDFYFNNITENGTEILSKAVLAINNPQLKVLTYNLDFNYIKNEGGKAVGQMLAEMSNLEVLTIGVASKNFGYLGFKHIVKGLSNLTELRELNFRCGINRVGGGGAQITRDLLLKLKKLTKVSLNFYENYVGDEGLIELTKAVSALEHLEAAYLNYGFNDAKGYGLVKVLEILSKKPLKQLYISFSSNQFQDSQVNLVKDELRTIINNTPRFDMDFMETAISKSKADELKALFEKASRQTTYQSSINVNSVITEAEETKYKEGAEKREAKLKELSEKDKNSETAAGKDKQTVTDQQDASQL